MKMRFFCFCIVDMFTCHTLNGWSQNNFAVIWFLPKSNR